MVGVPGIQSGEVGLHFFVSNGSLLIDCILHIVHCQEHCCWWSITCFIQSMKFTASIHPCTHEWWAVIHSIEWSYIIAISNHRPYSTYQHIAAICQSVTYSLFQRLSYVCMYTLQRIVIPSAANRCILCSEPPLTTFAIEKTPLTFDMAEWPKESLE